MREPIYPRRHPCPCGSGKKYKNCCDRGTEIDPDMVFAAERRQPGFIAGMIDALGHEIDARAQGAAHA